MLRSMVSILKHREMVQRLGLDSLAGVKSFAGELIKNHRGRRDIHLVRAATPDGHTLRLYLKRNWRPYKKDGLANVLRHGKPWSISRQEWEHSLRLQKANIRTADLVAYGEECGPLWEKFSFILTEAATGEQTVLDFLETCRDAQLRRCVFTALAGFVKKMHAAGLASPDLFTRHIFVDAKVVPPVFCLIDMARLDIRGVAPLSLRARDLAALHVTSPLKSVSAWERWRFLMAYDRNSARQLTKLIQRRSAHLLRRSKFREFSR